jgi:hypothetical protein
VQRFASQLRRSKLPEAGLFWAVVHPPDKKGLEAQTLTFGDAQSHSSFTVQSNQGVYTILQLLPLSTLRLYRVRNGEVPRLIMQLMYSREGS